VKTPVDRPRKVARHNTEQAAVQNARKYDYARAYNGLPPLYVVREADGWWEVDPAPHLRAQPGQAPRLGTDGRWEWQR